MPAAKSRTEGFSDAAAGTSLQARPILRVPRCEDMPPKSAPKGGPSAPSKITARGGPAPVSDPVVGDAATSAQPSAPTTAPSEVNP